MSGVISRTVAMSNQGEWAVVLFCRDMASAQQAGQIDVGEIRGHLMALMDKTTIAVGF